jgi:hypothetical protein
MTHHIDAILAPILEERMDRVQTMIDNPNLTEWSTNFWRNTFTHLFNQYKNLMGLEANRQEENNPAADVYLNAHQ